MTTKATFASGKMLKIFLLAGVAPIAFHTTASDAQQVSPGPTAIALAGTPQQSGKIEEVTVTVARRSANLQKVPIAIQVISGAKIAAQGITNIQQAVVDVPGVQASRQADGFSIDVRGQGFDLPSGSQSAVAFVLDGVYNFTNIGAQLGFFDLDNLEILPGPQSTQYGPDADGGVVDVNSKNPVIGSKSGDASLTVGNYNLVRFEAAQNIPISDVLAARIAIMGIYRGSYFSDPAESNNVGQSARIKLLYRPNDSFSAKLSYEIDHVGGTGPGFQVAGPPNLGDMVGEYQGGSINKEGNPWKAGDPTTNGISFANSQAHLYQNEVSLDLNYKINPAIEVDELAAFSDIVGSGVKCGTQAPFAFVTNVPIYCGPGGMFGGNTFGDGGVIPYAPFHYYSTETRLHNAAGTLVAWNLGFYHWADTNAARLEGEPEKGAGWNRTDTNAVYGQVSYPVLPGLHVIAGARYSFGERQANQDNYGDQTNPAFAQLTPDGTLKIHHFDYLGGLQYDVTPTSMVYAKVTTGYRPANINYSGITDSYIVQPNEVNTAIEAGTKNRFFGDRLQLNADFYYYIQQGYQFNDSYAFTINTPTGPVTCNNGSINLACQLQPLSLAAHNKGIEAQAVYLLTPDDQISDSLSLSKATFDHTQTSCRSLGLSAAQLATGLCYAGYNLNGSNDPLFFPINGTQQPHSPGFVTTVSYTHTVEFSGGDLKLNGEATFSSDYYVHPVENSYSWQPPFVQVSLAADYTPSVGNWGVSAYMHNLTNYAVKESYAPSTTIGDPRTYGLNLRYKW